MKFCQSQVSRFQILNFYNVLDEIGRMELANALMMAVATRQEAEDLVHRWLIANDGLPTVHQIYAMAREHVHATARLAACELCRHLSPGWMQGQGGGLEPCMCSLGRAKAGRDLELKAEFAKNYPGYGVRYREPQLEKLDVRPATEPEAETLETLFPKDVH
jgi:hypothetical protein